MSKTVNLLLGAQRKCAIKKNTCGLLRKYYSTNTKEWDSFFATHVNKGLNKLLDIKLVDVTRMSATLQVEVQNNHLNSMGIVHGGAIMTLADTAIGFGAFMAKREANGIRVVNSQTSFLAAGHPGDTLTASAVQIHGGHSMQIWEATVKNAAGKNVAKINSTVLNMHDSSTPKVNKISSEEDSKKEWFDKKSNWGSGFDIRKLTKEEIAKKFDKHAPNWAVFVEKSKYTPVFDWVKECANYLPNKNGHVLDLGCGIGLVGKALRANGVTGRMSGADISTEMLSHALKTQCFDGGVRFADLDNPLPFDEKFDLITCLE